ncbi:conserved protein of unknown function [Limnospira indica PCC 8005]|uniref:Uncharacterized protein n=1 Tax=Limnospira indica PCC 8005 TaxID=376219 RepID=A0A9P1NZ18_9CYAN|nr:conserved protein of unknown function [Limnospira indica PCC 8005]
MTESLDLLKDFFPPEKLETIDNKVSARRLGVK